ncbi:MAG: nucleotide pyrophosphatase [Halobacteriovoraceae bacterium]|nr:nucleotide pyrophosphatase [Halobacteriovoraceae bacterium]
MKRWHYSFIFIFLLVGIIAIKSPPKDNRVPANINEVPIVGFFTEGANALMNTIFSVGDEALKIPRDVAIFTIGGIALDVYISKEIPLDPAVKKRIMDKITNYNYASRLTYFLLGLKDRYTLGDNAKNFEKHIKSQYTEKELPGLVHSLFTWHKVEEEKKDEESSGISKDLIAKLITAYDVIFSEEDSYISNELPNKYIRLTNSKKDQKIINKTLPIIIDLLKDFVTGMEAGDMKEMVKEIIIDGKTENLTRKNNKATAATITLIDFVRMSVLKNLRIHTKGKSRIKSLAVWMRKNINAEFKVEKDGPLISYLKHANEHRKFGVQVVVDGLQGNLVEALALQKKGYLKRLLRDSQNTEKYKPKGLSVKVPEHVVQRKYLSKLASNHYKTDERYLPFFKNLYSKNKNTIFKNGIATTPTISVRNLPIAKTGADVGGQGGTGIPNFHFVDRKDDRAYYFFGNDALLLDELTEKQGMKTMFDRLQSYKTMNCNAQYDWSSHFTLEPLVNLGLGESVRDIGEALCIQELKVRAKNEIKIRELRAQLIKKLYNLKDMLTIRRKLAWTQKKIVKQLIGEIATLEEQTLPAYLLVYVPWPDHFAHFKGPFSDEILSPTGELNRLDYWLNQFAKTYQSAGVYDRTLFAMAGDHGLSPIYYYLNPESVVLGDFQKETGRKIIIKKISSDEGEPPKLTNPLDPPTSKNIDVIVASTAGGNYMLDFFNGQGAEWKTQPNYNDLLSWTPLSGGDPIDMISEIVTRLKDSLEYLVVRDTSNVLGTSATRIIGSISGKRYDEVILKNNNKLFYKGVHHRLKDHSLLKISELNPYVNDYSDHILIERRNLREKCIENAEEKDITTWCTSEEWRRFTQASVKPDSVHQLAFLYESDLAGTVNLFPSDGIGFNTIVPGRHAGESFFEKDAFVGFWGGSTSKEIRLGSGVNGSIAPTIYEYITGEKVTKGTDGWGFPSHLKSINNL